MLLFVDFSLVLTVDLKTLKLEFGWRPADLDFFSLLYFGFLLLLFFILPDNGRFWLTLNEVFQDMDFEIHHLAALTAREKNYWLIEFEFDGNVRELVGD